MQDALQADLDRMAGVPARPGWLSRSGPGNLNVPPERWGMTVQQFAGFAATCSLYPKYDQLNDERNDERNKMPGCTNLYQINDHFIKPWTRNTGNSIALLFNHARPLKAELMVSHAWAEDMMEAVSSILQALFYYAGVESSPDNELLTPIWFCCFAQYQAGDIMGDCGPTVAAQLALDPFNKVISSQPPGGMAVIHTSTCELYGRLWCVFEVNQAKLHLVQGQTEAFFSFEYLLKLGQEVSADEVVTDPALLMSKLEPKIQVNTAEAQCWSDDDTKMIRSKVETAGGFGKLDDEVLAFRKEQLFKAVTGLCKIGQWFETHADEIEDPVEFLAQAIKGGAHMVMYQCCAPWWHQLVESGRASPADMKAVEKLQADATECVKYFLEGNFSLPPCVPAPPGYPIDKDPGYVCATCQVTEDLVEEHLLDLQSFPNNRYKFYHGVLEMMPRAAGLD